MELSIRRWIDKLPPQLKPRGFRYHAVSTEQSATLTSNRIFVLPTRPGLFFLAVLTVMLVAATNYSNNMAFALTFLLGSSFFMSIIHTYRNLLGIDVKLSAVEDCFAGGTVSFKLNVINPSFRSRYDIKFLHEKEEKTYLTIEANDYQFAELSIPAPRRGRLPIGRVTVFTTYPFGLVVAWAYVDVEGEALVYPTPSEYALPSSHSPAAGEGRAIPEPGSDDFHGFREYRSGDSLRHINWKALAREQGLVTKQFQRHTTPELWFDWDAIPSNNVEERLSQLCRMILDADQRQQQYGLRLPHIEIPLGGGKQHKKRCLRQLALFGM